MRGILSRSRSALKWRRQATPLPEAGGSQRRKPPAPPQDGPRPTCSSNVGGGSKARATATTHMQTRMQLMVRTEPQQHAKHECKAGNAICNNLSTIDATSAIPARHRDSHRG
ncbi:hypothetical protein TSOC_012827 [Tetrabaena socialis]|uniref:Uncharacterized protein n=1 Tax=Tetrabaena socialis TaxID=47790 RepID=A0A2J7ZM02_9CHLO|nr:hypothetical protein TSOC_012827 [Tetrabaena socialis]|eukprot:PNH01299.1 hypothetical protein TSOC_012827 [Tetrabaena socialis]